MSFKLELRIPPWSKSFRVAVNGLPVEVPSSGLAMIERAWQPGDKVTVGLDVQPQWIVGTGEHEHMLAARKGPFILCLSSRWNPQVPHPKLVGLASQVPFEKPPEIPGLAPQEQALLVAVKASFLAKAGLEDKEVVLGPYALVQKEKLAVWLPSPDALTKLEMSLLYGGHESCSREGNVADSIADGEAETYRVTFDAKRQDLDWYEVTVDNPVEVRRIVFRHGRLFHNGGWFDSSAGKPEVFVLPAKDGSWKSVGRLDSYPQTTADKTPPLTDGQPFELLIPAEKVYGVRVAGKPACGDKAKQAFSSCAELAAFER